MIKPVLPVHPVDHTALDGLNYHNRRVEIGLLVHVVDDPVYKGTQKITFSKLNDSLWHNTFWCRALVKCFKFLHDLF